MQLKDRLKQLRKERQLTQRDVADLLHITSSAYGFYEQGVRDPSTENLLFLAEYYGCSIDYLMGKTSRRLWPNSLAANNSVEIPVLGVIRAGQPVYAEQNVEDYEMVSPEEAANGEYFYLRVTGDSMTNARIYPGDLVYVRRQDDADHRDIVVVIIDGENATIKRLIKEPDRIILQPESSNPIHVANSYQACDPEVRIIGKVLHVKFRTN